MVFPVNGPSAEQQKMDSHDKQTLNPSKNSDEPEILPLKVGKDYRVYIRKRTGLFLHDELLPAIQGEPSIRWTGGKISMKLWGEVLSFLQWAYDEWHSEAMIRLYYNEKTKLWKALACEQWGKGLHVEDDVSTPLSIRLRNELIGPGFDFAGTIHSHCAIAASQSSTDHKDEETKSGLHITVGHLDKELLDLHFRAVFRGVQSETTLSSWFAIPRWIKEVPWKFREEVATYLLADLDPTPPTFPEEWSKSYHFGEKPIKVERRLPAKSSPTTTEKNWWDDDRAIDIDRDPDFFGAPPNNQSKHENEHFQRERDTALSSILAAMELYRFTIPDISKAYYGGMWPSEKSKTA